MFLRSGDVKYMDVFERILYNGFLAGISFEGNTFFYPNPLETDGVATFNQGVCGRSPWFDCSCCPVNVVRVIPSIPGYIYAVEDNSVFVNLYMSNEADLKLGEANIKLRQETDYPWDGNVKVTIESDIPAETEILFRIPGWLRNEVLPGDLYSYADHESLSFTIIVNGEEISPAVENGYLIIREQSWSKGDQIELVFDMEVRKVVSNEKVEANLDKMAFERGPIVFCAEEVDNPSGVADLSLARDGAFKFGYDSKLLGGLGVITGKSSANNKEVSFKAIPYYAWAHRDMGEMAVWLSGD
jgi:DUF1680 family protein